MDLSLRKWGIYPQYPGHLNVVVSKNGNLVVTEWSPAGQSNPLVSWGLHDVSMGWSHLPLRSWLATLVLCWSCWNGREISTINVQHHLLVGKWTVEISWRKVYNPLVEHQRHCSPSIYKRGKCADKKIDVIFENLHEWSRYVIICLNRGSVGTQDISLHFMETRS